MKKKWMQSLNLADERYIDEANPYRVVKRSRRTVAVIAAVACLVGALSAAFFVIPLFRDKKGGIERYEHSPYYDLIQKLDAYYQNNIKPSYNTDGMKGEISILPPTDMAPEDAMDSNAGLSDGNGSYEEITDNQVAGVIEGDRIKRTDRYAFYLQTNGVLYAYSLEGESSHKVGSHELTVTDPKENFSTQEAEIYLSADGNTVTVMMPVYSFTKGHDLLRMYQIDVSDPANMQKTTEISVDGSYLSTRMVDGDFLVLTKHGVNWSTVDYEDPTTFVPCVENTKGSMEPIAQGLIFTPTKLTSTSYTVAARVDGKTLETKGSGAFLSYTGDVYVTSDRIYAFTSYTATEKEGNLVTNQKMTEIASLSYQSGQSDFVAGRSVTVEGTIKDRYSLDEKDGVLRVVTTTSITQYREYPNGDSVSASDWHSMINANLYCIEVTSGRILAEVAAFAPTGESVQSVRYDGNYAYVCTAIVFSDPVFFFDLSDLTNITYKETEPIDGFSSSLVNFQNGNLLGIGRTDWDTLKVEIYKEGAENVESVCKYELRNVNYSTEYKSYYIDRENQIVGLSVYDYNTGNCYYLVLHFDGQKLVERAKVPLKGDIAYLRGVYIDSHFYFFGENDFKVKELN